MCGIRISNYRVLTIDIQTFDLACDCFREYISCMSSDIRIKFYTPCFLEFLTNCRISNLLISRIYVRLSTHIAGTLYVILSTKRVNTTAFTSKLANHHCHIGHGHNALCTCGMFGYTKAVDDWSAVSFCIHDRCFSQIVCVNVADFSYLLRCVIFYDFL